MIGFSQKLFDYFFRKGYNIAITEAEALVMEETQSGVTFGEIVKAVKKRLWIVLIATLALAVLAVLAAQYLFNPSGSTYSLSFTLSYPGSGTGKYPDGSPFYYQEIISLEALNAAKTSDGRFDKINVEKLSEKDGISIELSETGGKYTLTAKARYFSNRTEATLFLRDLAKRPLTTAVEKSKSASYTLDEAAFYSAGYEGRLEVLARQKESILAQYDEWIELYRENYSAAGKTLANHRAEADVLFSDVVQSSLASELETNGYVLLEYLDAQRKALQAEKEENERKIEALRGALKDSPSLALISDDETSTTAQKPLDLSETLAALLVRNVQIDSQLQALTEDNIKAFDARLDEVYAALQSAANKVQAVGNALCEQEARVYFDTAQAVQNGGIGLALAAVGGLIIGFLLSCLVVCLVEIPKSRRSGGEEAPQTDGGADGSTDGDKNENQE